MDDYIVNVPSYQRSEVVQKRTLQFLADNNIDRERVTVWVADEQEYEAYRRSLDPSWSVRISSKGLVPSRCHYHQQAPAGQPIVNIDDDVETLLYSDGKRLHRYESSLDKFIRSAFQMANENGVRLWGINGAANAMFLKSQVTVGLRYLIGAFFGSFAGDSIFDLNNRTGESSGEDFEAALMAFVRDGAIMRFDGITLKTAYFAQGGIDAELKAQGIENRQQDHQRRLEEIASQYPGLAKTYTKAGGVVNIRLRTITAYRIPWEATEQE